MVAATDIDKKGPAMANAITGRGNLMELDVVFLLYLGEKLVELPDERLHTVVVEVGVDEDVPRVAIAERARDAWSAVFGQKVLCALDNLSGAFVMKSPESFRKIVPFLQEEIEFANDSCNMNGDLCRTHGLRILLGGNDSPAHDIPFSDVRILWLLCDICTTRCYV